MGNYITAGYWQDCSQSCSRPFVGWHFPGRPVLFHSCQLPFCKGGIMHLSLTTCLRNLCGTDVNKAILLIHRCFHSSLCICSKPAHTRGKYNRSEDKLSRQSHKKINNNNRCNNETNWHDVQIILYDSIN